MRIQWQGFHPTKAIEEKVILDLQHITDNTTGKVLYHLVDLTSSFNGPCVIAKQGADGVFQCHFHSMAGDK